MKIFFSAGDPSGDQHAAHMISELQRRRTDIECIGFGGTHMQAVGCRVDFQLTDLAVMGVLKVLPMLLRFVAAYRQSKRIMDADKPDAVMLVNFPGFNWWIARAAKKRGIPVFFYLPPQLWAWGPWRIKRVRQLVDHVMSPLQFETDWYRSRGIDCHFVGHPFFDQIHEHPLDQEFVSQWSSQDSDVRNVAILPGSRTGEVVHNWHVQLNVMREVYVQNPSVRFLVASYKQEQLDVCRAQLAARNIELPIHFFVGKTAEVIDLADCSLMVSGSVSLELLARRTPAVVLYGLGEIEKALRGFFQTCEYISLPNLIADRQLMPEFVFGRDTTRVGEIAGILSTWLQDESARQAQIDEMETLCRDVVKTGATERAVNYVLSEFTAEAVRRVA